MKNHLEKCMRIISDLVAFCHSEGGEEFQIFMTHGKDLVSGITVSCTLANEKEETIETMGEERKRPRQHGIEQNHWERSGGPEMSGELSWVGRMIREGRDG